MDDRNFQNVQFWSQSVNFSDIEPILYYNIVLNALEVQYYSQNFRPQTVHTLTYLKVHHDILILPQNTKFNQKFGFFFSIFSLFTGIMG